MKKLILSIILTIAALISVNAAIPCKEEHNSYIQISESLGWHTNSKFQVGDYWKTTSKHKKGFGGAIAIGYIMDSWRFELEGSYRRNVSESFTNPETCIKSNTSLMLNVLHDIALTDLISLYVGAGAGFSSVKGVSYKVLDCKNRKVKTHNNNVSVSGYGTLKRKNGHLDVVGAAQVMAGLTYKISDNVDLFGGYRLFATTKPSFKIIGVKIKQKNIPITQCVETGLRFKF